mgnify:CR=1 FL=1
MEYYRKRIIELVYIIDDEEQLEIIYRFIRRYLS